MLALFGSVRHGGGSKSFSLSAYNTYIEENCVAQSAPRLPVMRPVRYLQPWSFKPTASLTPWLCTRKEGGGLSRQIKET